MIGDTAGEFVAFEALGEGRTAAMLGAVQVGSIFEDVADRFVAWRLSLSEISPNWRRARNVPEAKAQLRAEVANWVDAAGLAPASQRSSEIRAYRQAPRQLARGPA